MNPREVIRSSFKIAGVKIKANNKELLKRIPLLWNQFFVENVTSKIKNKADPNILYAVYTNYQNDQNGNYDFMIGFEVLEFENLEGEIVGMLVDNSKYLEYTSQGGSIETVKQIWQTIWQSKIDRKYKADFEVYDLRTMNTKNSEVKVLVGIK